MASCIVLISQLFVYLGSLSDSLEGAKSQTQGLAALRNRYHLIVALRDLIATLVNIVSESTAAVYAANDTLHELEREDRYRSEEQAWEFTPHDSPGTADRPEKTNKPTDERTER